MSTRKRDYYEVLGLTKQADDGDIKKAYRRLAMQYHPDRNPGNAEAEEKFKEAAEAYQVLSDTEKRARYDRFGHQGVEGASGFGGAGFSSFEDIFSAFADIFGGGGGRSRVPAGDDLQVAMDLTFLEAAKGTKREIEVERHVRCSTCNGSGAKPGTQPVRCKMCGGQGQVAHRQGFFTIATTCPQCRGQGVTIAERCPACKGSQQMTQSDKVTVTVPAGVDDGTRLRMAGQGDPSPAAGGEAGDLYVLFRVKQDPRFVRQGDDLLVEVPLTFAEAALGTTVQVPTLDGFETLDVPAGTQPMSERVLSHKGVANVRGRGHGDLIVRLTVQVPRKLDAEAKGLLEKLAPHLGKPRDEPVAEEEESPFRRFFRGKKK